MKKKTTTTYSLPPFDDDDEMLANAAAAKFIGYEPRSLEDLRYRKLGPKYFRLSRKCIRYKKRHLREFLDARLRA